MANLVSRRAKKGAVDVDDVRKVFSLFLDVKRSTRYLVVRLFASQKTTPAGGQSPALENCLMCPSLQEYQREFMFSELQGEDGGDVQMQDVSEQQN